MAEAPGLGAIRFDPSITPEQQAEITQRLGATPAPVAPSGTDFGFEYMDRRRQHEREIGAKGFNSLLSQAGLDASGNALPGPVPPPPDAAAKPKPSSTSTVSQVREGLGTGFQEGSATVLKDFSKAAAVLDRAATWINQKVGTPQQGLSDAATGKSGGAFGMIADTLDALSQKVAPSEADLKDKNTFTDYLARAIGAAPPTIAEYLMGGKAAKGAVGGFALIEAIKASDQGAWEAFKGAVKGAVVGKGFEYLGQFSRLIRAGGTAALFGGEAALSGASGAQVGASAVAGGLMGAITPTTTKPQAKPTETKGAVTPEVMPALPPGQRQAALPAPEGVPQPGQPIRQPDLSTKQGELAGPAERLGLPAPEGTPRPGEPIQQPDLTQRIAGYLPKDRTPDLIDQALAKTNAEADAYLESKRPKSGLEDFIAKDEAAAKALAAKPAEAPQVAAKVEVAAQEIGVKPEDIITAARVIEEVKNGDVKVNDAIEQLLKQKRYRATPGDMMEIKRAMEKESDPFTLFDVALQESTPRDIKQTAANRINDLRPKEINDYLVGETDLNKLLRISRSSLFPTTFRETAKALALKVKEKPIPSKNLSAEEIAAAKQAGSELGGAFTSPKESPEVSAEVVRRGKEFLGEKGFSRTDLNILLAKTLAGALFGATQGDTTEERIKNGLMLAGLSMLIPTKGLGSIVSAFKKIDPKAAKQGELKDTGHSAGAEDGIKINQASEQQIKDFFKLKPEDVETQGRVDGINFDHINTPQDVKLAIGKVAKVFQRDYSEARKIDPDTGAGVSHKETMDFAKSLGMTEEKVLTWPDGKEMNRGEIMAAKVLTVHSARELQTKVESYLANPDSPTALADFIDRFNKHSMITKNFLAQSSEKARTLEALKIDVAGDEVVFIKHLGDVVNNIDRTGWEPERLAKALKDLPDQAGLNQFTRNVAKPGKADALLELWYGASLLSNPKTLTVNAISTPLALGWQIGKRFIAAGMTSAMGKTGDPNYVQWNEPMSMMWGIRSGYGAAWKAATDAFTRGEMTVGRYGKFEVARQASFKAETFGVDAGSNLGMALDYLGHAARTFPRVMQATDQFLEVIGRSMEVHARAAREAASKTTDPMEMGRLIREGVIEDNVPPGIKEAADQFAIYNSFNSESGSFTAKLQQGIETLKTSNATMGPAYYLLAKSVAPFITIPVNIAKWTVREGPLAVLAENFWQQMGKGGADAQIAMAGVGLGSIVMASAAFLTKEGIITDRGPADSNERRMKEAEQGWQPYSFKIGDRYLKGDRLDPIAMPIFWAADLVGMAGHLSEADYFQAAASMVMAITRPLSNKTYLSGLSNFMDAVFSDDPKAMYKFLAHEGTSIMPGFVRGIRQQVDPYQREVHTMLEALRNQVPGLSSGLAPVTDALGRPILSGYGAGNDFVKAFGIINPIAYREAKQNPIIDEILANRVHVSAASDTIYGSSDSPWDFNPPDSRNGVKLTPWEYNAYKKISGDYFLEKAKELFSSDSYRAASPGPDGGKAARIRILLSASRDYGRREILREFPEIDDAVREKMAARRQAMQ